jgi:hypothetical protein
MPRPKSELTKSGKTVGVRVTVGEWEEYVKLGMTKWLRATLRASMGARQEEEKRRQSNDHAG